MTHNLGMAPYRLPGPGICPPDFKPPSESPQIPSAPSNPKKRRKTSNAAANSLPPSQAPPTPQDLLPPPLTGHGDTIVASNPFDDTPTTPSPMSHGLSHMAMHGMNPHLHHHHMGGPPMRGMSPLGMSNMNPMAGMGGPMGPGPMPPHMNSRGMSPMGGMPGASMGGMSPMGGMGPMGGPPNSHMGMNPNMGPNGGRSIGSPMSGGPIGSPMNSLPMGSPMGSTMGSPLGGPGPGQGHMNNGQMGPPMHSPLGNGPSHSHHMPGSRMNVPNGAMSSGGPPMSHQMNQMVAGGGGVNVPSSNPMTSSSQMVTTNSMNTLGGHSPMNHQNVPLPHGSGGPGGPGGPGGGGGGPTLMGHGHGPNHMNSTMSSMSYPHGMSMGGPLGPNHLAHMGHMGGPGSGPMNGPPNSMAGGMFGPKPMPVSAGKIYPPGQPMVFNPQNPNAPPIYPCGLCHKEVNDNDEALFCESGCNFFFHRSCSGLTEAAFQLISKEIYAEWCCDKCLSSKNIPLVKFKC